MVMIDLNTPISEPMVQRIVLERLRHGIDIKIDPSCIEYIKDRDLITGYLIDRVVFSFYGLMKKQTVELPANWWEHFKQRWYPAWILKRYPVKMKKYEFTCEQVFPEIPMRGHKLYTMAYVDEI